LAKDCVDRTLKMFADEVRKRHPNISEAALAEEVEKERVYLVGSSLVFHMSCCSFSILCDLIATG
jgi:hypothetical protein